jgi:two-component system sensor histidine kinase YesM
VYLLDEGGFFFKYVNGLATANAGVSLSDYRDSDWYRDTLSMNGLECYFLTNVMTGRSDGYVSVTKLLRDLTTGEPYGILVINISSSELDGLLPPVVEQKGITYVIIDSKGEALRVIGSGAQPASAQALLEKVKGAQGNSIAGYGTETRTGWEIRCLLDSRTVMLANIGIPLLTLFFALGLVILSLACSLLAARSITQPLKRLGVGIEKMRAGARLDIGPFGDDEVGRIGNALIEMAAQRDALGERLIRQSVQAKEAELKALQAQINPHFLYNTLSSIYWLAKLGMSEQAAQAAVLLSENFKYVTAKDGDMVTVEDELNHVKHYIEIQNVRYNGRIDAKWDVDESLYGAGMLKFVLQPIIENAIYHGLEPKIGPWELSIALHREGDEMVFKITDNGVGMDVASARKGYGMKNVHERICLKYGEGYGCTCESSLGEGTIVSIRMPYSQGVI